MADDFDWEKAWGIDTSPGKVALSLSRLSANYAFRMMGGGDGEIHPQSGREEELAIDVQTLQVLGLSAISLQLGRIADYLERKEQEGRL